MLDALRQGAQGWVAKGLMVLLVLSFGIWGVAGRMSSGGAGRLATVGDTEVGIPEFSRTLEQAQRSGRQVTPDQVLNSLLLNAALDDEAANFNLGISDDRIARQIADDKRFQGQGDAFDRDVFTNVLNNSGIDRHAYVEGLREDAVRQQIAGSLAAGITAPQPIVEALYRFQNEERTVSSLTVDAKSIQPLGAPDAAALKTYFDANNEKFRAPEYRKLGLLVLDPTALADPAAVTPEAVAADYARRLDTFTTPERRRVEQIAFKTAPEAEAALTKTRSGTDFAAVAAASNVPAAGLDLGLKTKAEFIDPAVAEAAFAAQPDVAVAVVDGAVQPSLIRVTAVEAGSVTPQAEVEPRLRQEIATRTAREHVQELYDKIEDERAGGATLEEVSRTVSLPYRIVDAVAQTGVGPDGRPIADLPSQAELLQQAFDSDVGVENNAIRGGNDTFTFFEVLEITPARDKALDESRAAVVSAWTAQESESRIAARAEELLGRLQKGETLAAIAAEIGAAVTVSERVKRGAPPTGLSANAAAQAFAGPQGHAANAESDAPPARILLVVDSVTVPAYFTEAADAKSISAQLNEQIGRDILDSYNRQLLAARRTIVNQAAYAQITGSKRTQ